MIKTVFLDLDDVLADFMKGLHKALNISYDYSNYPYRKGDWDILGHQIMLNGELVTFEQCNACCNTIFWIDLGWTCDGHEILRAILDIFDANQIYLLTAPMPNLETASGKMMWVHENLPVCLKNTIITQAPKHLLARPDTLLIDDKDQNIDEFREAGGQGILVPRPWNELHGWAGETLQVIKNSLEEF